MISARYVPVAVFLQVTGTITSVRFPSFLTTRAPTSPETVSCQSLSTCRVCPLSSRALAATTRNQSPSTCYSLESRTVRLIGVKSLSLVGSKKSSTRISWYW